MVDARKWINRLIFTRWYKINRLWNEYVQMLIVFSFLVSSVWIVSRSLFVFIYNYTKHHPSGVRRVEPCISRRLASRHSLNKLFASTALAHLYSGWVLALRALIESWAAVGRAEKRVRLFARQRVAGHLADFSPVYLRCRVNTNCRASPTCAITNVRDLCTFFICGSHL